MELFYFYGLHIFNFNDPHISYLKFGSNNLVYICDFMTWFT